jgi:hypothetical protein
MVKDTEPDCTDCAAGTGRPAGMHMMKLLLPFHHGVGSARSTCLCFQGANSFQSWFVQRSALRSGALAARQLRLRRSLPPASAPTAPLRRCPAGGPRRRGRCRPGQRQPAGRSAATTEISKSARLRAAAGSAGSAAPAAVIPPAPAPAEVRPGLARLRATAATSRTAGEALRRAAGKRALRAERSGSTYPKRCNKSPG